MEGISERQTPFSSTSADIVIPQPTSASISQKTERSFRSRRRLSARSALIGANIMKSARWHNHENIIPFIAYSDEGNEKIMVSEYANNHSLEDHLQDPEKRRSLNWAQRLKIGLGAARGLAYLHSGLGEDCVLIHRNFKSSNILLDDSLRGLCLSRLLDRNQQQVCKPLSGIRYYLDPIYKESGIRTMESDIYSFGVSDRLDKLIDPYIKDEINDGSFFMCMDIAYDCISLKLQCRPTMVMIVDRIKGALNMSVKRIEGPLYNEPRAESEKHHRAASTLAIRSHQYQNRESFLIPLDEIKLATRNFSENTCIKRYGSAVVYRGRLSECWRVVVFKCLDATCSEGEHKFRNEVDMMLGFTNENIVPFIGYCDEGNEMIIVTEYAVNRSLNHHLQLQDPDKRSCLTWKKVAS